jgi:hypothetical protein
VRGYTPNAPAHTAAATMGRACGANLGTEDATANAARSGAHLGRVGASLSSDAAEAAQSPQAIRGRLGASARRHALRDSAACGPKRARGCGERYDCGELGTFVRPTQAPPLPIDSNRRRRVGHNVTPADYRTALLSDSPQGCSL